MDTQGNVLITGASTGIGRACAVHLASMGFAVWAGVRREGDAPLATGIRAIRIDVTDNDSI
ncbi:MAG: SDR family NAD(P)-dependent oxidoreductase, partial [Tepidisphaeraceae bacterium]